MFLAGSTGIMTYLLAEWALAASFTVFFIFWSFGNALFYGETRRSVDSSLGVDSDHMVSAVFMSNSAVGTLLNGIVSFITFTLLGMSVENVFELLAALQAVLMLLLLALAFLPPSTSSSSSAPCDAELGACNAERTCE
ncbi:unnamed protein product [Durusdinium trenchii]|uniref:Solute carrier family 40 protein n=1 Tax=Durusdinium trenchii TaxID=1381693 RepID=A0ABP0HNQ6_9DINO